MLRQRALADSALDGHRVTILFHDQTRTLCQAVFLIADLGILSAQRNRIRGRIIHSSFARAALTASRRFDTTDCCDLGDVVIAKTDSHVGRVHNHILLLGMNIAQVMSRTRGIVIIQFL